MSSKMDTEKQMFSAMPERIHSSHEKNTESVEPGVERTLVWKLDLVFLPMLGLAYLLAYMVSLMTNMSVDSHMSIRIGITLAMRF